MNSCRQRLVVWCAAALVAALVVLAAGAAGCGSARQTADSVVPAETADIQTAKILDMVQPVGLMESLCTTIGEVSLSPSAAAYQPPAQVSVYKIAPTAPVTRESMDALADQFGFGSDRQYGESWVRNFGNALAFHKMDDVGCYWLEGGGGEPVFRALTPEEVAAMESGSPLPTPPPPSPEETRAIADAFLEKWGVSEGFTFVDAYEASVTGTLSLSGKEERWVTEMGARYQAYVGGVPLVGAGAKVSVRVNLAGHVIEFLHFAEQATESDYAVTIRSVNAALEDLRAGRGEVPGQLDNERAKHITVEGIEVCYYAAPVGSEESYYKPVYVFHVRMSDGTLGDWTTSAFEGSTAPGAI